MWQNAGLIHGKVLVPYIVRYFLDIIFQVVHVSTQRGPSFTNLYIKRGLKEKQPSSEGYHHGSYMCMGVFFQVIILVNIHCNHFVCSGSKMLLLNMARCWSRIW